MINPQQRWLGITVFAAIFGLVGLGTGGIATKTQVSDTAAITLGAVVAGFIFTLLGWLIGWLMFRRKPSDPPPVETDVARPWQPRFQIGSLLLLTFVVSIAAAAGYYMVRALRASRTAGTYDTDRGEIFLFLAFTFIAPVFVMVLLSFIWGLLPGRRRRK